MEENKKYYSFHLHISGVVQGVGFRFFAINRARTYGITGWVRNLYDGSVEIEAEGTKERLIIFLEDMRIGPPSAHIRSVVDEWHEIAFPRYESFTVGY